MKRRSETRGETEKKVVLSDEVTSFYDNPIESFDRLNNKYFPVGDNTFVLAPINSFETLLYSQFSKEGNLVFSPFSIATALGMVYEGARDETASEILALFQCPPFSIATALGMVYEGARDETASEILALFQCPPFSIATALGMVYEGARDETASEILALFQCPPFSIATALGMVYEGARDETASEILALFQCPIRDYGKINASFHSANAVFIDQRFEVLKGFTSALRKYYKSGCIKVDFRHGAREQINDWVSSRTNDKIKDLLPVVDPNTKLILVNAIYFLGDWEEPFDPRRTTSEPFFTEGKEMKVKMMYRKMEQASYAAFNADGSPFLGEEYPKDGFQVLEIPYKQGLSMVIVLPSVGSAFPKFSNFNCKQRDVDVSLPKFKVECQFELTEPLQALGMKRAFSPAAQLQGIAPGLIISKVIHKAFVDVNEQGTEAAAATAVMMKMGCARFIPEFNANRPFMFAIRIRGHLLFMGRFVSP